MTLEKIKEWLEELLCAFQSNPRDTTPERQKLNRASGVHELRSKNRSGEESVLIFHGIRLAFNKREAVKDFILTNMPAALPHVIELRDLLYEWCFYFDRPWQGGHQIDELRQLIIDKLTWMLEKIDSL